MAAGERPATMRAVQYSGYGGGAAALKFVEIHVPSVKKDEVLVKVEAASINQSDLMTQKGMMRPFHPKFPFIPVNNVSGEIVEVGSAVREFKVGDKVVSKLDFWLGRQYNLTKTFSLTSPSPGWHERRHLAATFLPPVGFWAISDVFRCWLSGGRYHLAAAGPTAGGLAEYVATSDKLTVARPAGISAADAAGVPVAGLTALQALKAIGTKFDGSGTSGGADVLITAASSGVGTYAVQLAKLGNHRVTATCGARNLGLVAGLGADEVLDYKTPEGAALSSPSGKKYDYIVNISNKNKWSVFKPRLSSHGRVVDVAPNFGNFVASVVTLFSRRKKLSLVSLKMSKEDLGLLLELMREGKLRTVVDSRHPFEKAADAWARSLSGHATGKVIVEM
uniref:Enoyl reductase (ER) domain-containing protein n=1 Tax=Oryza glumipatula TaxID=40148 RepID=A0A0D9ZJG9_9ORYZ